MSRIYGTPGLFGETRYTDESGKYLGESLPGIIPGTRNFYDSAGSHVGYGTETAFGGENFYSDEGGLVGHSIPSAFCGSTLYSEEKGYVGWSHDTLLGSVADFSDPFKF